MQKIRIILILVSVLTLLTPFVIVGLTYRNNPVQMVVPSQIKQITGSLGSNNGGSGNSNFISSNIPVSSTSSTSTIPIQLTNPFNFSVTLYTMNATVTTSNNNNNNNNGNNNNNNNPTNNPNNNNNNPTNNPNNNNNNNSNNNNSNNNNNNNSNNSSNNNSNNNSNNGNNNSNNNNSNSGNNNGIPLGTISFVGAAKMGAMQTVTVNVVFTWATNAVSTLQSQNPSATSVNVNLVNLTVDISGITIQMTQPTSATMEITP